MLVPTKRPLPCLLISLVIGFIIFVRLNTSNEYVSSINTAISNGKTAVFFDAKNTFLKKIVKDTDFEYSKIVYTNGKLGKDEQDKSLLVLSSISNNASYGAGKTFQDLYQTISLFEYSQNAVSLGFLVGDVEEFRNVELFFDAYFLQMKQDLRVKANIKKYVAKVTLISAPFIEKEFQGINRNDRHSDSVQRLRRRSIARSRNFLLFNALEDEKYTLFVDADIVRIKDKQMVKHFISSGKDIIVPRIVRGDLQDYDKNSWVGERTKPTTEQYNKMDRNEWANWDYVPRDVDDKMMHFDKFIMQNAEKPSNHETKKDTYMMKLDSVGGAILFLKSVVYKQGAVFPPNYIIGTTWERLEGYDGIETEGLCYVAKVLGYKCYGMPNLIAYHSAE